MSSIEWRQHRGLRFGKTLSDLILDQVGDRNYIVAVIRGHQHSLGIPGLYKPLNYNIFKHPHMSKHFVFTSVASPNAGPSGRGFMEIKLISKDPSSWTLTSIWSLCQQQNSTMCEGWKVSYERFLTAW